MAPSIAHHVKGDGHIQHMALIPISKLAPFSMLILSIVLVILFLIKQFIFEGFLMRRLYKSMYTSLDDTARRGFINHHIAGGTKALILVVAVYPFIRVAFRDGALNTPYAKGSPVTLGDILLVCAQLLVGMYIFELIYRNKISPISSMHHIGAIIVTQAAIAISLDLAKEPDATVEFILCTVWGAFDIVCELIPHIAIIIYRIYPNSHLFLSRLFLFACISTFFGTICETIVIFYLFGSLWNQWQIAFKVVTPLLHCAFSATQIHGSRIFYLMWRKQIRILAEEAKAFSCEKGNVSIGETLNEVTPSATEEKKEHIAVVEVQAGGII
ncbi:hypothetical protein ACLMJK_001916 [Lecanora helva]